MSPNTEYDENTIASHVDRLQTIIDHSGKPLANDGVEICIPECFSGSEAPSRFTFTCPSRARPFGGAEMSSTY